MTLSELLEGLEPTELERLAGDKLQTDAHVRLPPSLLRPEVESVLKSFSYVQQVLGQRHPPAFGILHVLLEAEGNALQVDDLRRRSEDLTKTLSVQAASGDGFSSDKQYGLYRRVLAGAWKSGAAVDASESALLAVLRRELGISLLEHLVLEHHPDLQPCWYSERAFERERNALLAAGILFAHEDRLVVPQELVSLVREAWDLHLTASAMRRLYEQLTVTDLADALRALGLKSSGSKEEKVEALLRSVGSPRLVLDGLNLATSLRDLARRVGCAVSGAKEDLVERLLRHFEQGLDLVAAKAEAALQPQTNAPPAEPKVLSEVAFRGLFSRLTGEELYEVLSGCDLRKSGSKDSRVEVLWSCPYSEPTVLGKLTNRSLALVLERCGLKLSGPKDEKVQRLVDHFKVFRAGEQGPVIEVEPPIAPTSHEVPSGPPAPIPAPIENHVAQLQKRFPFLDRVQAILVSLLEQFQTLTDLELERLAARHDLHCYFLREEMRRLILALGESGTPIIERRESGEHDLYLFRGAAS